MGIAGLLPFLENASRKAHASEFKGATAAVDSYCWLHKGAIGCAEKLARGEDVDGYVLYCMKYIRMLQLHQIRPIMVFDGQHLPAKKLTEEKRRKQRQSSKQKAVEMLCLGNNAEARRFLLQSIDITHSMALALIKVCRSNGIDCIVAPYEADAQLAYLNLSKLADFVISEDSDLLLFGCKKIFYKMDVYGHGIMVEADKINNCMKLRSDRFTFDKFRYMCILSGCDYLENLPGVGLKKALKFISVTENPSIYNALPKLPTYLKLSNAVVTDEYRNNFMLADATFRHQLVFDPKKRCLLPLNPVTPDINVSYCKNAGDMKDNKLAFQLALGNIDPFTHQIVDDWNPDSSSVCTFSIWSKAFHKTKESVTQNPIKSVPITKYKVVIAETSREESISYDPETENMLDMYRKMGPAKRPTVSKTKDLHTLIYGEADISEKRNSRTVASTVIDYDNGVRSRFFKPKNDKLENENHEPMVSLLGAIDNLIRKRKTEDDSTNHTEKSPEILTKRRKSDAENKCESMVEIKTSIKDLTKKFEFKKEKVQSVYRDVEESVSINKRESHIHALENIIEVADNERKESVHSEIVKIMDREDVVKSSDVVISNATQHIATKRVIKSQSSILRFFRKQ